MIAEDDDEALEVDMVDGDARFARRGILKREAKTLTHLLTPLQESVLPIMCTRQN